MAISYHVYGNDGQGGSIDYTKIITTIAAASASPLGSFTTGPLASPSDNSFAVRAFDDVSGVEEANTDARVRVVVDANGQDVSARPNAVVGLAVRWTVGKACLVSWGYATAGQGGAPIQFNVSASPQASGLSPVSQSVAYVPGIAGYGCQLPGLATASNWTIQVGAMGVSDAIVGPLVSVSLTAQSGVLAPVDGLVATSSA